MIPKVANSEDMHTLVCTLQFNHRQSQEELYAY